MRRTDNLERTMGNLSRVAKNADTPVTHLLLQARYKFQVATGERPTKIFIPKEVKDALDQWCAEQAAAIIGPPESVAGALPNYHKHVAETKKLRQEMLDLSNHIFGMDVIVRNGPVEAK